MNADKRGEHLPQLGQAHFRLIVDGTPALVDSAGPDGEIVFLNRGWSAYTGLAPAALSGWRWASTFHPDDVEPSLAKWRSALAAGEPFEAEARVRRADGAYRTFLHRRVPERDDKGNVVRWHGASIDIDDLKRTQRALQESEERFRRMADALPEVIWFTALDPERVVYASPSFERIWGLPLGALYRNPRLWMESIHAEDRVRVGNAFSRWIAGEQPLYQNVEYRVVRPDGSMRWIHERGVLSVDESGKAFLASGISTDITERKQAEEELRRSEAASRALRARFEGILEIAEDAIITVDAGQRIVLFNQGAEKAFGYAEVEVMGSALDRLLPQRSASAHARHLADFARSAEIARRMDQRRELFGRRKDGSEFPAEASISKLDVDGEWFFTVILRDVTERKQAAEALRASEHLARGQLDALTHTLDALAQESDVDRLLEHVLRTIAEQSGARSVNVWDRHEEGGGLDLRAVIDGGQFRIRGGALHPAERLPLVMQRYPVWGELLLAGQHGVLEDLDRTCARMCVGPHAEAEWHPVLDDRDCDPEVSCLKGHLRELDVRMILFVPMTVAGRVAGIVGIYFTRERSFVHEEIELTRALTHQATLANQLVRLSQQSRRAAVAAERNRLARDIHDTLAQGFTGVIVQLEAAADARSKGFANEADAHLVRAGDLARESLREARRSVHALRPLTLEANDLCEALRQVISRLTEGTAIVGEIVVNGQPVAIPATWEENILRIGQEAVTNALRHARARRIAIELSFTETGLVLRLRDDGQGFDPTRRHDGFGLLGIEERVTEMGGQLNIRSAIGDGTEISVTLPIAAKTAAGT